MLLRSVFLLLLTATSAAANPWPQNNAGTFLAITEDFGDGTDPGGTEVFIESGRGQIEPSIGLSSALDAEDEDWSAFAFIRQPLTSNDARDRVSLSAGFGAQQIDAGPTEPLLILGGAWGRDVEGAMAGWLSLEGEARYLTTSGDTEFAGGATVAVQPTDRIALVNEFSLSGVPGSGDSASAELTSSIVGNITDRARIQLGATVDLSGNSATGFRLGTWLEF